MADLRSFVRIDITAVDSTKAAFDAVDKGLSALEGKAKAALAALTAAFGVGAFTSAIKEAIDYADQLNKMAQRTGIAVEALDGLSYSAKLAGVDMDTVGKSLQKLAQNMTAAAGGNAQAIASFEAIGVSVRNADGSLKSMDEVMLGVADKFATYRDGAAKAALAQELFGKRGAELIPLLNAGRRALEEQVAAQARYGGVSAATAAQAEQFNDTLSKLQMMSAALWRTIAASLLPTLQALADIFVKAKENANGFESVGEGIATVLKGAAVAGLYAFETLRSIGISIGAVAAMVASVLRGEFKAAVEINDQANKDLEDNWKRTGEAIDRVWSATAKTIAEVGRPEQNQDAPILKQAQEVSEFGKQIEKLRKMAADATVELRGLFSTKEVTAAQKAFEELSTSELWDKMKPGERDMLTAVFGDVSARQTLIKDLERAAKAAGDFATAQAKERTEWEANGQKRLDNLQEIIEKLDQETQYMGYSNEARQRAIALTEAQRLRDQGLIATDEELADVQDRLVAAFNRRDFAAAEQAQVEQIKRTAEEINSTLADGVTDGLMRGFEHGKDSAQNFVDTLRNMFRTLVLRPVIQGILAPVAGAVAGLMPGTANALGTAGNAAGLYGMGSGLTGSLASGISSLFGASEFTAGLAGDAFMPAMLASTADVGAAGLGASLAGAVPYVGWALAAAAVASTLFGGKGGGPKSGGFATGGLGGLGGIAMPRFFDPNSGDAQASTQLASLMSGYGSAASALGFNPNQAQFAFGFDTDPNGTAQSRVSAAANIAGQQVYYQRDIDAGRDDASLQAAIAEQAKRVLFAAVQSSIGELPSYIQELFKAVDAATSDVATLDNIMAVSEAWVALDRAMATSKLPDAVRELIDGIVAAAPSQATIAQVTSAAGVYALAAGLQVDALETTLKKIAQGAMGAQGAFFAAADALSALIDTFDYSAEASAGLAEATRGYASAAVALIGQLEQVRQAISTMFGDSIRSIQLAVMTPDQQRQFYTADSRTAIENALRSSNPQDIQRYATQYNQDLNASFALLSPEEQRANAAQYISAAQSTNALLDQHLQDVEGTIQSATEDMISKVGSLLEAAAQKMLGASDAQVAAANAQLAAANTPVKVDVTVSMPQLLPEVNG